MKCRENRVDRSTAGRANAGLQAGMTCDRSVRAGTSSPGCPGSGRGVPGTRALGARDPDVGCPGREPSLSRLRIVAFPGSNVQGSGTEAAFVDAANFGSRACKLASSETQACKPDLRGEESRIGTMTRSVSCAMRPRPDRDGMSIPLSIGPECERCKRGSDRLPDRRSNLGTLQRMPTGLTSRRWTVDR
jgi:hypothetical protein